MVVKGERISTNERDFILQACRQELRVDGRGMWAWRRVHVRFGRLPGTAEVQLGRTRVLAVTSADIMEPKVERPTEGFLQFHTEFSPMASPHVEMGRGAQSELAVELARIMERCIKGSRALDTEALCVVAGKKVWCIQVDVTVLDDGGNLIDCANLAALASLIHFKRPEVTITGEDVTIHSPNDREPVPLSIHHLPICCTFALMDGGVETIADPSHKEELVMDGRLTVAINVQEELCLVHKYGGVAISSDQINKCARVASTKAKELNDLLMGAFKKAEAAERKLKNSTMKGAVDVDMSGVVDESGVLDVGTVVMGGEAGSSEDEEGGFADSNGMEVDTAPKAQAPAPSKPAPVQELMKEQNRSREMFSGGKSGWDDDDVKMEDSERPAADSPAKMDKKPRSAATAGMGDLSVALKKSKKKK